MLIGTIMPVLTLGLQCEEIEASTDIGMIMSPGYPDNYSSDAEKCWSVVNPGNGSELLVFEFGNVSLPISESAANCKKQDRIMVKFDDANEAHDAQCILPDKESMTVCGDNMIDSRYTMPKYLTTSASKVQITFKTNGAPNMGEAFYIAFHRKTRLDNMTYGSHMSVRDQHRCEKRDTLAGGLQNIHYEFSRRWLQSKPIKWCVFIKADTPNIWTYVKVNLVADNYTLIPDMPHIMPSTAFITVSSGSRPMHAAVQLYMICCYDSCTIQTEATSI
jgi:hypothetical protein